MGNRHFLHSSSLFLAVKLLPYPKLITTYESSDLRPFIGASERSLGHPGPNERTKIILVLCPLPRYKLGKIWSTTKVRASEVLRFLFMRTCLFPLKCLELSLPRLLCAQSMMHLRYACSFWETLIDFLPPDFLPFYIAFCWLCPISSLHTVYKMLYLLIN